MASGKFNISTANQYISGYVEWTETNTSIQNNTSVINLKVYLRRTNTYTGAATQIKNVNLTRKFYINGETISTTQAATITIPNSGAYVLVASTSKTINHDADGSKKNMSIGFEMSTSTGITGFKVSKTTSTATLDTIPRSTACPAFTAYVEKSVNIGINPASSSFTHSIKLVFGSNTAWLNDSGGLSSSEVKLSSTAPLFNIPSSYYNQFAGASAKGTITLYTYSGGTLIGSKTNTFTIYADTTLCKPYIQGNLKDSNTTTIALTGNENKIVKGFSNGLITFTTKRASSSNDNKATITSLKVNGVEIGASKNSYTINGITAKTVNITATNSRGSSYSSSFTISASGNLVDYVKLTLNASFYRTESTTGKAELTYSGNYFAQSFGNVANSLELSYAYREKGATAWSEQIALNPVINTTNNTYSETVFLGNDFNYKKGYEFIIYYKDKLVNISISGTPNTMFSQGVPILWWNGDKVVIEGNLYIRVGTNLKQVLI